MKKMLFFSVALVALVFLVVSCAPKEPQTPEEKLTDEMHAQSDNALAGQAIRIRCATAAVTNCQVADDRILFTYRGYNYNYPTGWCSGKAAYNAYAYNSRCISPTVYENCIDQCTGLELCSNGVCAVRGGDCRAGGEPSRCLDQGSCLSAGFKWLNFDMDPDDAPRGCYASCPPGVVDSNNDGLCNLEDNQFGCSANNMCESNNCVANTCQHSSFFCFYLNADGSRRPAGTGYNQEDYFGIETESGRLGLEPQCNSMNLNRPTCTGGTSGEHVYNRLIPWQYCGYYGCSGSACCTSANITSRHCDRDALRGLDFVNATLASGCSGKSINERYCGDGCRDGVCNIAPVAPAPAPAPMNYSSVCCGDGVFNVSACNLRVYEGGDYRGLIRNCTLAKLVCVQGDLSAKCG